MTLEIVRGTLMWCTIINYVLLTVWAFAYLFLRASLHRLWNLWFRLSPEQYDILNFIGLTIYKLGIFLFNLVPWVALWIVG